jgi:uncharacterized tellurite resistance protein B-like protein
MIHRQFYIELGKLLYSISKSDGIVQEKEKDVIERIIHKALEKHAVVFNGNVQEKEVILTKLSFNTSERNDLTVSEAYLSFITFMKKNGRQVDEKQKEFAKELIQKVAAASRGISKEESASIEKLLKVLAI